MIIIIMCEAWSAVVGIAAVAQQQYSAQSHPRCLAAITAFGSFSPWGGEARAPLLIMMMTMMIKMMIKKKKKKKKKMVMMMMMTIMRPLSGGEAQAARLPARLPPRRRGLHVLELARLRHVAPGGGRVCVRERRNWLASAMSLQVGCV